MSGWGKGYVANSIIETNVPEYDISVILDYKDEYRGICKSGLARHCLCGPRERQWSSTDWASVVRQNGDLVVSRLELSPDVWRTVCARIVRAVRRLCQGSEQSGLVVIDEAHFVAPQRGGVPDPIKGLATTGRGEGVSSIWITQRLTELLETVIAQWDSTLFGGFQSARDRKKLKTEYPAGVHNPEHSGDVRGLPSELHDSDGDPSPLQKRVGPDGEIVGTGWIKSDSSGTRERWDSGELDPETVHYGGESQTLDDPI